MLNDIERELTILQNDLTILKNELIKFDQGESNFSDRKVIEDLYQYKKKLLEEKRLKKTLKK